MLPGREASGFTRAGARAVEGRERLHFVGRELLGGRSHLLIDVILANPLGEGGELPFEVSGMLPCSAGAPILKPPGP